MGRVLLLLALGAVLFAAKAIQHSPSEESPLRVITIDDQVLEQVEAQGLDAWVEEEILYREGVARGFDRAPGAVARLLQLGRSLGYEGDEAPDVVDEVESLGLDRTDPVLRAQVAGKMRLLLGNEGPAPEPSDAELETLLASLGERFAQPPRISLRHVFFSRDRRGEALDGDARQALKRLRENRSLGRSAGAGGLGDPFAAGHRFAAKSERDLTTIFGPSFAARAMTLRADEWSEPLPSAYGVHLVWVSERRSAARADLAAVRAPLLAAWRIEQADARRAARLSELRSMYELRFAPGVHARLASTRDRG
jgi:hypothetical protein